MCRILALQGDEPVAPLPWIEAFAERCRASREYQGDGWGVAWRENDAWVRYRSVQPIWDDLPATLPSSRVILVHARSAFRNEGVTVENNMPFIEGDLAFAFNGELRGVRLAVPGETGAARLLHVFKRFRAAAGGDGLAALARLDEVIASRTEYVRALNLVISDGDRIWINARHSEDPDYFTLYRAQVDVMPGVSARMVTSERLAIPGLAPTWDAIPNHTTRILEEVPAC
jgi:predicted glutamine amidotransferase